MAELQQMLAIRRTSPTLSISLLKADDASPLLLLIAMLRDFFV